MKPVRYVYGVSSALLIGGAAISLVTGHPAGAQVAQNDEQKIHQIVPTAGAPASFADLTAQLQPAVVNIATRQQVVGQNIFGRPTSREAQALGSGFVISADGYVVTNNHVITADGRNVADSISVKMFDGTEYPAVLVGRDAASDIAVLKVDAGKPLPFVKFGDSEHARAGDWVIAIGNPFGLGGTVTAGIISSPHRNTGYGAYDQFIQTDASINSGNSGGPMFDMEGNVIGINRWIIAPSGGNIGIGFAIPSATAAPIVEKLKNGQEIERGYIGVIRQPLTDDYADSLGLPRDRGELIQGVEAGEPAEKAGIKPGDIVMRVNGQDVTKDNSLSVLLANITPGSKVPMEVLRQGKTQKVTVTVGRRPSEEELANRNFDPNPQASVPAPRSDEGNAIAESLGVRVAPLTAQIAGRLGVPPETTGLVVLAVDGNSDAAQRGLQRADIILSANYQVTGTVEDLEAAIVKARSEGRASLLLNMQRPGSSPVYVPVRLASE